LSRALTLLLEIQSQLGGSIPFERFMGEALYNPDFGYYTKTIRDVGRGGDFSTFATLGGSLAEALVQWICAHSVRDVIEVGPGNGQLAGSILQRLGWWRRWRLRYHLVDVDGPLRAPREKRLRGFRIRQHASMTDALRAAHGRALIFSNELPDAFPCRVFERTSDAWREVHVRIGESSIEEILLEAPLPDSGIFNHPCPVGQRVEVHESYRRWLESWAKEWKSGSLLTIDYGDTAADLYRRRPRGTLRGYAHHQRLEGTQILQAPGRIDLTADVNFSDLENWGASFGWKTIRHSTLADLLPATADWQTREAAAAFRILEQSP
jgi:SAM-dependent MidA family methyltransferase